MNTRLTLATLTVLTGLLTFGLWMPAESSAQSTGFPLSRLSADFLNFDDSESSTIVAALPNAEGGTVVYRKTVFVPFDQNVLYITFSATGDTHDGAALWLACRVNGSACNPGAGGAGGAPSGWMPLNKLPAPVLATNCNDGNGGFGDCHDNSIYATWCVPIAREGGTFDIELRLATSAPPARVFFEMGHIYIDSNCIDGNACDMAPSLTTGAAAAPGVLSVPRLQ